MQLKDIEQWKPILSAILDGKQIQYKHHPSAGGPYEFRDVTPDFNIGLLGEPGDFRIKPEEEVDTYFIRHLVKRKNRLDVFMVIGATTKELLIGGLLVPRDELRFDWLHFENGQWLPFP